MLAAPSHAQREDQFAVLQPAIDALMNCGRTYAGFIGGISQTDPSDIAIAAEVECRAKRTDLVEQIRAEWPNQASEFAAMIDEEFRKQAIAEAVRQRAVFQGN